MQNNNEVVPNLLVTSDETGELFKALGAFQAEMGPISKSSDNPFFRSKYASLPDIQSATKDALGKAGLVVSQHPIGSSGLATFLYHPASKQMLCSRMEMAPKEDTPQGRGSSLTYMRRYSYAAILGLIIEDEDDDGNAASGRATAPASSYKKVPAAPKPVPSKNPVIDADDLPF